jgi:glycosyltransferase involved in cell wall biosynthesis
MNQQPLITLGLPVYNGEKYIGLTLQSILVALQNTENCNQVEILVSDNLSTDHTSEVVDKFINMGLNIQFYCNEINVGFDGNIDVIVKRAHGKYVWFLGCGEKVKEDALLRLIQKLDNAIDYTNIVLDFDIYDEMVNSITAQRVFSFKNDVLLEGKNNFQYTKYGPAVSSNIINKCMWMTISKEKFVVDGWCHIERVLSMIALREDSKTLLLPYPYFTLYREKNGWWVSPNSYLMLLLHIKVIKSMFKKGFSLQVIKKLELNLSRRALITAIVQSKFYGLKVNKNTVIEMVEIFKYDYFFWLIAFPILIVPSKLLYISIGICQKITRFYRSILLLNN